MGDERHPFYEVAFFDDVAQVHADELEPAVPDPTSVLAAGTLGDPQSYALRLQALYLTHAYRYDRLSGLSNARIEPHLHQVYVAHRVMEKLQPRMILADEVGLGKTIEAALIVKELLARQTVSRILIICPANLVLQWRQELATKFNEPFEIVDSSGLRFLGRDGGNGWLKRDRVICSIQFASSARVADQLIEAPWDLVIFDEAHRVRRWRQSARKVQTTQAYRLADELKELTSGLLLLTATPMQLHSYELFSLIELVEPGLFRSFDEYERRRSELPSLNDLMKSLQGWEALSSVERDAVAVRHAGLLEMLGSRAQLDASDGREKLMDRLVERHPLAAALVRNRKSEVGVESERIARRITVELTEEELDLYRDVTSYIREGYNRAVANRQMAAGFVMVTYQKILASSSYALRQSFQRRIESIRKALDKPAANTRIAASRLEELEDAPEASVALREAEAGSRFQGELRMELAQLQGLVDRLGKVRDSKALELLRAVRTIFTEHPDERLLIFTQFIETQLFLVAALKSNGYTVAIFNGSLSSEEKEEAVRQFRYGDAQILISTEAGGEGRNFQFCHLMVNYDLPWNPMKVEQRIGRLDRIGQKKAVFIYNLACEGTIEMRILDVLEARIGLFVESVGALDPILGEVERNITRILLEDVGQFDQEFTRFEESLERQVRRAREKERTLGDFVLDRASLRRDIANKLLDESPLARFDDLQRFVERSLEFFGGSIVSDQKGAFNLAISSRLASGLQVRADVTRGAFNPDVARDREELEFLAFGHPIVDGLVRIARTNTERAMTGARLVPNGPSELGVEVWYEIQAESLNPRGRIIRHVVGSDLAVISEDAHSVPESGEALTVSSPIWVAAALAASAQRFDQEHAAERAQVTANEEAIKEAELHRAERIFKYRQVRLTNVVTADEEWIHNKEMAGTDRDRKILPARRGKVAKDKARLSRLRDEHEAQVESIRSRRAGTRGLVLGAGLILGSR